MVQVKQTEFWAESAVRDEVESLANDKDMTCGDALEVPGTTEVLAGEEDVGGELPEGDRGETVGVDGSAPGPLSVCRVVQVEAAPGPRFNMARFLRLTGSLDGVDNDDRWYRLPRKRFRPSLVLGVKKHMAKDFWKDLCKPPRNEAIKGDSKPSGWLHV